MNPPTREYSTILFDFDYTLADSSVGIVLCTNYALRELRLPERDAEMIRLTIGLTLPKMLLALAGEPHLHLIDEFTRLFIEHADEVMTPNTAVFPFTAPLLTDLRQRGYKLGIVSTKRRIQIAEIMRQCGLDTAVDVIVGYEDVTHHKPDPESLQLAMQKLGEPDPARCLYVGDSVSDGGATQRLGMPFVGVLTGKTTRATLSKFPHVAILDTAVELLTHV